MAPSFDHLHEEQLDDLSFDEDELDFSDLRERYEVQMEQSMDTFVVVDGLPDVTEDQKTKLVRFLVRKLNSVGKTKEESVWMYKGDDGKYLP
jgi:translation initiation factor 3 subunit B